MTREEQDAIELQACLIAREQVRRDVAWLEDALAAARERLARADALVAALVERIGMAP